MIQVFRRQFEILGANDTGDNKLRYNLNSFFESAIGKLIAS
jgi:hypothetical protein